MISNPFQSASRFSTLAAGLVALCAAASAQADTLAAGPLFGGAATYFGACYAINTGTATVGFTAKTLRRQDGTAVQIAGDTCGNGLAPQASCFIAGYIDSSQAYSCEFSTSTSARQLRGNFDIRNSGSTILVSSPLR